MLFGGGRKLFQSYGVLWIQKISILTPWRLIGNSKGERRGGGGGGGLQDQHF